MFFMRLSLRLGVLALLCAGAAHAQTAPRSYAVLSEMAREINLVAFQESIGSRLNNNHRERIEVRDGVLDKFVLTTARARLAGLAPGAGLWLIAPLDTELFPGLQNPAVGSTLKIPEDLMQAMKEQKSTHLLLFTRHRDEADFELSKGGHAGSGAIEGVGFYVDRQFMIEDQVTRTTAAGFLLSAIFFGEGRRSQFCMAQPSA